MPQIKFEKHRLSKMFMHSKCLQRGICHCVAGGAGAVAVSFEERWIQQIRRVFWAKTNKQTKKKEKSLGRELLESAKLIVRLHAVGKEPAGDTFLHLGYGNYSSWRFGVLRLLLEKEMGDSVELRVCCESGSVTMFVDAVKEHLDVSLPCEATFYCITENDEIVREDEMLPQFLVAKACDAWGRLGVVWRGAVAEQPNPDPGPKARAKAKAKAKASARRARARGEGEGEPLPDTVCIQNILGFDLVVPAPSAENAAADAAGVQDPAAVGDDEALAVDVAGGSEEEGSRNHLL